MSDYSTGVLFKKEMLNEINKIYKEELTTGDFIIYPLNEKWQGLFPMDMFLMEEDTISMLKRISREIPLFYFMNCEDHDWGYKIFADGEEKAFCMIPVNMNNPESCISQDGPFISKANLDMFKVFDIDEKTIMELRKTINVETIDNKNETEEIRDRFMELLDIREFRFMSYNYLIDEMIDDME